MEFYHDYMWECGDMFNVATILTVRYSGTCNKPEEEYVIDIHAYTFTEYFGENMRMIDGTTWQKAVINCNHSPRQKPEPEAAMVADRQLGTSASPADLRSVGDDGGVVCSTVTLQFSQTMYMTRQAFRGTLTLFNGHDETAMRDVRINMTVTDPQGAVATSHEFQVNIESIKDFGGSVNTLWTLDAQATGTATVLFIPTKYAAPSEPIDYAFGGTLTYIDPFTDLEVTRDLSPVTLTVKPSPNLELTYFMQRDVFGDDPFTAAVEPSQPAEFALLINNIGEGEATDLRMVTNAPKIIDNEKGLLVNFSLISSSLNGFATTMALGGSVPTQFGNIQPGKTAYAQWQLTSSLLGHFTEYDVTATHITSYGNPDLSLLDKVSIHEMLYSFTQMPLPLQTPKLLTCFLVNDIPDDNDLPDAVYLSDGSVQPLSFTTQVAVTDEGANVYAVTVTPAAAGWNYGYMSDPTGGSQKLSNVTCNNGLYQWQNNFRQTDRTLRDGYEPLVEYKLHFADYFETAAPQTYIVHFEPKPVVTLAVDSIIGAPALVAASPLTSLKVFFNKTIDPLTFTAADLQLQLQGAALDASTVTVTPYDATNKIFTINLNGVNSGDGYYVLTVKTVDIEDTEGFTGEKGKTTSWNQYAGGKVTLTYLIEPADAGTVNIASGTQHDFQTALTLKATANAGWKFDKWTLTATGETLSTDSLNFTYTLVSPQSLTATFKKQVFDVALTCPPLKGKVTGGGSGKYEYGTTLTLHAEANVGWEFTGWLKDGVPFTGQNNSLVTNIYAAASIEALFTEKEATFRWTPASGATAWDASANWSPAGIPNSKSTVIIPKSESYPLLTDSVPLDIIRFEPGAEIGRQDLMKYNRAFVQMDFSAPASRNRWWMLSNPFKEMFVADYSFGGYPGMDIDKFAPDGAEIGRWTSKGGVLNEPIAQGEGFLFWLRDNRPANYGLTLTDGLFELPFFDNPNVPADAHWTHTFSGNVSNFKNWSLSGNVPTATGTSVSINRTPAKIYRLADREITVPLAYGKGTTGNTWYASVGNPYMSSISISELAELNPSIRPSYQIWVGAGQNNADAPGSYIGYDVTTDSKWGRDLGQGDLIPPLQGFLVTRKSGYMTASLDFELDKVGVAQTGVGVKLRSTRATAAMRKLTVTASNPEGAVLTSIVLHPEGESAFGELDYSKLLDKVNSLPEVYTLKPAASGGKLQPTAVNVQPANIGEVFIPLCISTTYSGAMSIIFSGLLNFEGLYLSLYDYANSTVKHLPVTSDMDRYTFNYSPVVVNGTAQADESRFALRIGSMPVGLTPVAAVGGISVYSLPNGTVRIASSVGALKSVKVYSLTGTEVFGAAPMRESYDVKGLSRGVFLVRTETPSGVSTVKVAVR